MAIEANDFLSNSLTGTVAVSGGQIIYEDTIQAIDFEGSKTFSINFRRNNFLGPIIFTTNEITLVDSANITGITSNTSSLNEGDLVSFSITSENVVSSNLTLYYSTLGNVSYADFEGGNVGSFYLVNGTATVSLQVKNDLSTDSESDEQFQLQVRRQSATGPIVGTSSNVIIIKDTSNTVGIQSTAVTSNLIYESQSTTLVINTIGGTGNAGGTVYYTITGNADIYSSTSGAIIINDNTANLEIIAEASVPSDEVRSFAVQLRSGSISGTILDTSETVYVQDAGSSSISATGGDEVITIDI